MFWKGRSQNLEEIGEAASADDDGFNVYVQRPAADFASA
jgi:hypothetical protein